MKIQTKRYPLALVLLALFSLTIFAVSIARSGNSTLSWRPAIATVLSDDESVTAKSERQTKPSALATAQTSISETTVPLAQATPEITQSALTGGGGDISGLNLSLTGAIGQGVAGTINGRNLSLHGGFLGVAAMVINSKQQLIADDAGANDRFGLSLSTSGDLLIVGAPGDTIGFNASQGSAYVFVRNGDVWGTPQKLLAPDGARNDDFAHSVAISGDWAIAGAPKRDLNEKVDQGVVYVFKHTQAIWEYKLTLSVTDGLAGDLFGDSVAISGDTIIVGAPSVRGGTRPGSAYVFRRNVDNWEFQQKLSSASGTAADEFGGSVTIKDNTVLIGALGASSGGAAYFFERNSAEQWVPYAVTPKLTASDGQVAGSFGCSVALSSDTALIGAVNDGAGIGAVSVFVRSGAGWAFQQKLLGNDSAGGDNFGSAVALNGNTALMGAYKANVGANVHQGAAYIFTRNGTAWTQQNKLTAPDGVANSNLGWAVALSGNTALAGVPMATVTNISQGAVCIFSLAANQTAPTFTPAAVLNLQQGSSAMAPVTVGMVSDGQTAPGSLTVTQIAGGTSTGITVHDITNTNGVITALVSTSSTATSGTVRFQVSNGSLTGTGDLQVNVSPMLPFARTVRVRAASGNPGNTVIIPIELVSQGDENALVFSLTFDPMVLSNPTVALGADASSASFEFNPNQSASGRLGLLLALPAGQSFLAGVRRILNITFTISAMTTANSTPIEFGNQPLAQEVSNASAELLPASFVGGMVLITRGFEADAAPRPDGNGMLSMTDYVQVGLFVAKLDTAANGGEFQRADCAPRNTFGDGRITIIDLVQAGRYVVGLDPAVPASGPTSPSTAQPFVASQAALRSQTIGPKRRTMVRVVQISEDSVAIELDGYGTENALSFSLNFDPKAWRFASAETGSNSSGAWLAFNANEAAEGRFGFALALPSGQRFAAGSNQVAIIRFKSINDSVGTVGQIGFADFPVTREVVNDKAEVLSSAFSISTETVNARAVTVLSEAGLRGELRKEFVTAESQAVSFGEGFTTTAAVANGDLDSTELAGVRVWVRDSSGIERPAAILSVSPDRIAYRIPAGTAEGFAVITIVSSDGTVSVCTVQVAKLASIPVKKDSF